MEKEKAIWDSCIDLATKSGMPESWAQEWYDFRMALRSRKATGSTWDYVSMISGLIDVIPEGEMTEADSDFMLGKCRNAGGLLRDAFPDKEKELT